MVVVVSLDCCFFFSKERPQRAGNVKDDDDGYILCVCVSTVISKSVKEIVKC